jgi:hypothetical protein
MRTLSQLLLGGTSSMMNKIVFTVMFALLLISSFFAFKGFHEQRTTVPSQKPESTKQTLDSVEHNADGITPEVRALAMAMLDKHASDQDFLTYMRQMRPLARTSMDQTLVRQFGTFIDEFNKYRQLTARASVDKRYCAEVKFYDDGFKANGDEPVDPHGSCMHTVNSELTSASRANAEATEAMQNIISELHIH